MAGAGEVGTPGAGNAGPDSEALLHALLDVPELLVLVTDHDGGIVRFNRGCEQLTGYRAADIVGEPIWERLLPAEDVTSARESHDDLVCGGAARYHRGHWLTRDGHRRLVEWTVSALTDGDGRIGCLLSTGIEVTEYQRLYRELSDREARLHAVLETAVDGVITIDEAGRIESVNTATERIFGYAADELVGASVCKLMPEPYRSEHDSYLRRYLETGQRRVIGIGREAAGLRKDGSTFPLDLAISEVDVGGRRLFTGMVRDVSARKAAEAQSQRRLDELAHASRLSEMGEMTSGIAHEVNQPLAAIVSFAEACTRLLENDASDQEVIRGALAQIAQQARRAGDIVQHLRQFARKGDSGTAPIDINETIRSVLVLVGHELVERRVEVDLDLEPTLPPVLADKIQVEQVVLNLIRNAAEAMQETSGSARVLSIRTGSADEARIEIVVSDTGVGLTESVRERLFETFFTTKADGVGVGLSISRSLVESHRGRLWAGPAPQTGAAFHFTLPLAEKLPGER